MSSAEGLHLEGSRRRLLQEAAGNAAKMEEEVDVSDLGDGKLREFSVGGGGNQPRMKGEDLTMKHEEDDDNDENQPPSRTDKTPSLRIRSKVAESGDPGMFDPILRNKSVDSDSESSSDGDVTDLLRMTPSPPPSPPPPAPKPPPDTPVWAGVVKEEVVKAQEDEDGDMPPPPSPAGLVGAEAAWLKAEVKQQAVSISDEELRNLVEGGEAENDEEIPSSDEKPLPFLKTPKHRKRKDLSRAAAAAAAGREPPPGRPSKRTRKTGELTVSRRKTARHCKEGTFDRYKKALAVKARRKLEGSCNSTGAEEAVRREHDDEEDVQANNPLDEDLDAEYEINPGEGSSNQPSKQRRRKRILKMSCSSDESGPAEPLNNCEGEVSPKGSEHDDDDVVRSRKSIPSMRRTISSSSGDDDEAFPVAGGESQSSENLDQYEEDFIDDAEAVGGEEDSEEVRGVMDNILEDLSRATPSDRNNRDRYQNAAAGSAEEKKDKKEKVYKALVDALRPMASRPGLTARQLLLEFVIYDMEMDSTCQGTCVCGKQGIKYMYHIRNRNQGIHTAVVGSECVNHFCEEELASPMKLLQHLFKEGAGAFFYGWEDDVLSERDTMIFTFDSKPVQDYLKAGWEELHRDYPGIPIEEDVDECEDGTEKDVYRVTVAALPGQRTQLEAQLDSDTKLRIFLKSVTTGKAGGFKFRLQKCEDFSAAKERAAATAGNERAREVRPPRSGKDFIL